MMGSIILAIVTTLALVALGLYKPGKSIFSKD